MNKFLTEVSIEPLIDKITHSSKLTILGSCFSENIGNKLKNAAFKAVVNPFGVLFNPISVKNSLIYLLENRKFIQDDLFLNGSLWSSFSHSSLFSATNPEASLAQINNQIAIAHNHLLHTDFLLITLGTAYVYKHKASAKVVANCHKLPSNQFERTRLTVDEIVVEYEALLLKLKSINPKIQLVFTVSPVRHWKDGAHENTVSKGMLHMAIDKLRHQFDFVHYFPAYEIQVDELRDYRFYAEDMLHPNSVAVDYIWQKFIDFSMNETTKAIINRVEDIRLQESHRALHPETKEHQVFLKHLAAKKQAFEQKYPDIKL